METLLLIVGGVMIIGYLTFIFVGISKDNAENRLAYKIKTYDFILKERNRLILEVEKYRTWERILQEKNRIKKQEREEQEIFLREFAESLTPQNKLKETRNGWMLYHYLIGVDVVKPEIVEEELHRICEKIVAYLDEEEINTLFHLNKKQEEWLDEIYKTTRTP